MQWISDNSVALGIIVQVVLAALTLTYVAVTYSTLREIRQDRLERLRPRVVVHSEVIGGGQRHEIFVFVRNIGATPAADVRFEVRKDFDTDGIKNLGGVSLFARGIPYLPPGNGYPYCISTNTNLGTTLSAPEPGQAVLHIEYRDAASNATYCEESILDLAVLRDLVMSYFELGLARQIGSAHPLS